MPVMRDVLVLISFDTAEFSAGLEGRSTKYNGLYFVSVLYCICGIKYWAPCRAAPRRSQPPVWGSSEILAYTIHGKYIT